MITAPTPVLADGLFVVARARAPERPLFAVRSGARGDLTLPQGTSSGEGVAWSYTGRGSYMPTPLFYDGLVYVLNNNGIFDAYEAATGKEVYRQRLPDVGSGFSASPVAADGRIYLSSEDGDMNRDRRRAGVQAPGHEPDGRPADGHTGPVRGCDVRACGAPPVRHRAKLMACLSES